MIPKEPIFQYYSSTAFAVDLPSANQKRHFRFRLWDGSWRSSKRSIKTVEELQVALVKLGAVDAYYSTSKWMNPLKVSSKGTSGTYWVADNLLLGNDLVFDIDRNFSLKGLEEARLATIKIYEGMKKFEDYEFKEAAFTGSKGFRLIYSPKQIEFPPHPRKRIAYLEAHRKLFIERLRKEIGPIPFDHNITTNAMCVVRVLGTVNSNTGYIARALSIDELNTPIKEILDNSPHVWTARPEIPKREMTHESLSKELPRSPLESLEKDVAGLSSPPLSYHITNRVLGIRKGFVPILVYQKEAGYWKEDVSRLQDRFSLGHLYVFTNDKDRYVVSLKTMQRRQMERVMIASSSRAKHTFKKLRRVLMPIDVDFVEKLHGQYTGHLSRGHKAFVDPKSPKKDKSLFCGWDMIELVKVVNDR